MKPIALACLALMVLPTAAQGKSEREILALGQSDEVQHWIALVSRQIDATLRYPYVLRESTPTGGVSVTFRRSDSGAPDAIRIARSSGSRVLDQAALSAIRRIKTLHPLPESVGRDQLLRANIVFATDAKTLAREEKALRIALAQAPESNPGDPSRPIQFAIAVRRD